MPMARLLKVSFISYRSLCSFQEYHASSSNNTTKPGIAKYRISGAIGKRFNESLAAKVDFFLHPFSLHPFEGLNSVEGMRYIII
jgi:hypothetical protein